MRGLSRENHQYTLEEICPSRVCGGYPAASHTFYLKDSSVPRMRGLSVGFARNWKRESVRPAYAGVILRGKPGAGVWRVRPAYAGGYQSLWQSQQENLRPSRVCGGLSCVRSSGSMILSVRPAYARVILFGLGLSAIVLSPSRVCGGYPEQELYGWINS